MRVVRLGQALVGTLSAVLPLAVCGLLTASL